MVISFQAGSVDRHFEFGSSNIILERRVEPAHFAPTPTFTMANEVSEIWNRDEIDPILHVV